MFVHKLTRQAPRLADAGAAVQQKPTQGSHWPRAEKNHATVAAVSTAIKLTCSITTTRHHPDYTSHHQHGECLIKSTMITANGQDLHHHHRHPASPTSAASAAVIFSISANIATVYPDNQQRQIMILNTISISITVITNIARYVRQAELDEYCIHRKSYCALSGPIPTC